MLRVNWFISMLTKHGTKSKLKWNQINNWIWKVNQRGISSMCTESWSFSEKIYIIDKMLLFANYNFEMKVQLITFLLPRSSFAWFNSIWEQFYWQSMRRQWKMPNLSITWVRIIIIILIFFYYTFITISSPLFPFQLNRNNKNNNLREVIEGWKAAIVVFSHSLSCTHCVWLMAVYISLSLFAFRQEHEFKYMSRKLNEYELF